MARRLIVEITETAAIQEIDETARFVAAVRDLGCRVALDDFGVGYSSFQHLKSLPVDLVKIDGSFVDDMAEDERSRLFVHTLLGLAAGFGLTTVAESIDSSDTAALLTAEGVTDRSEARRVGKEWYRTCRARWAPYAENKKNK